MHDDHIVRWGVLGTARIASRVVAPAIHQAAGNQLAAIASRSAERAAEWAAEHGAARSYSSYEELLDDPEIDAAYIPLPPSMHAEWTVRAAERGKHVLCEKPLAANLAQAEEMAAACREANVLLMDGQHWLHHPRTAEMHAAIHGGDLGTVRRLTSAFTWNWDKFVLDDLRMQRELGGGSLLDLGWYCVAAAMLAFGEPPQRVWAAGRFVQDVDVNLSAVMWFSGDRVASFDCAFDTGMRKWFEVAGTNASLVCDDFARPWNVEKPRYWLHDAGGKMSEHVSEPVVQEVRMIEHFGDLVRGNAIDHTWAAKAVVTQRICDAIDRAARTEKIVDLGESMTP